MGTLDEKFLDGPNVGYCSDSDEEPQPSNEDTGSTPISGRAGAKGVLDDYRAFQQASRVAFLEREKNVCFYWSIIYFLSL